MNGRQALPWVSDNKPGAEKVTILGHEIWQRDFNGDPNIVGQSVRINGRAATVIGVMPANFKFPVAEQLWVSLYNEFPPKPRGELLIGANNPAPAVIGRLKTGVQPSTVQAELSTIAARLAGHPKVETVRYPGIGGLISFDVAGGEAARLVETSTRLIENATSLGGTASVMA